jgi:hypothetical protein
VTGLFGDAFTVVSAIGLVVSLLWAATVTGRAAKTTTVDR